MNENRFVIRTVKDGKVKVYGEYFVAKRPIPSHFEGLRFAFGRYKTGDEYLPLLNLWGTEAEFKDHNIDEHQIYCDDEGFLMWQWWKPIGDPA